MRISSKLGAIVAALAATILIALILSSFTTSQAATRHHIVEIKGLKFAPESLTIRQGDMVEWINRDIVQHTATKIDKAWDTRKLKKGESAKIVFSSLGTESYLCIYHPKMRGEIVIIAK